MLSTTRRLGTNPGGGRPSSGPRRASPRGGRCGSTIEDRGQREQHREHPQDDRARRSGSWRANSSPTSTNGEHEHREAQRDRPRPRGRACVGSSTRRPGRVLAVLAERLAGADRQQRRGERHDARTRRRHAVAVEPAAVSAAASAARPRSGMKTTGTWMISGCAGSPNARWISTGQSASESTAATATIGSHGGRAVARAGTDAEAMAAKRNVPGHARPYRALRHQRRRRGRRAAASTSVCSAGPSRTPTRGSSVRQAPGGDRGGAGRRALLDAPTNGPECTFAVDDLDAALETAHGRRRLGVDARRRSSMASGELAFVADPGGNVLGLMRFD